MICAGFHGNEAVASWFVGGGAGDPGVGGADTSWFCRIIQEFMPMTHESSPYEYAPQRFALAPQGSGPECGHIRIGNAHPDSLLTYPDAHNLSRKEQPIRIDTTRHPIASIAGTSRHRRSPSG